MSSLGQRRGPLLGTRGFDCFGQDFLRFLLGSDPKPPPTVSRTERLQGEQQLSYKRQVEF